MKFKFKNIRDDWSLAIRTILKNRFGSAKYTDEQWSESVSDAFILLAEKYIEANKVNELIELAVEQFDSGISGFAVFQLISEALVAAGDPEKVTRFWSKVILQRTENHDKTFALEGLRFMRIALAKLGDVTVVDKLQAKLIQQFAAEKAAAKAAFEAKQQGLSNEHKARLVEKFKEKKAANRTRSEGMNESEFWQIIERAKIAESCGDTLRVNSLKAILTELGADEVQKFAVRFEKEMNRAYTWDLWGIAYIAFGGCSDDGFAWFRAWLISEGKETFEKLIKDPESFVDAEIRLEKNEAMLLVADDAYTELTGSVLETFVTKPAAPTGVEWSENERSLKKRFKKAYAFYH